jgi:serine/threonine protein kinase
LNQEQKKKEQVFGKYTLKKLIRNESEIIKTFAAVQRGFDRLVELRILLIPGASDSPMAKRFIEEIKVLTSVEHPSIISVLDQGIEAGKHYFTTVLHNSIRLEEYLKSRGGSLPETEFLKFAEILTDAVSLLHSEDKLHRGISTKSIFVNLDEDDGIPYIGECSAMKDIREESLTSLGLPTMGEYIPTPEGIAGTPIDKRTDVFLLCNLFYEMLAGKPALPSSREELISELRKNPSGFVTIPPLEIAAQGATKIPGIDALVMKGLDPNPENRWADAYELAEALRSVANRHQVMLFIRENATKTARMRAPKVTFQEREEKKREEKKQAILASRDMAGPAKKATNDGPSLPEIPEKWIIGGGIGIAILLILYIGTGLISTDPAPVQRTARVSPREAAPENSKQLNENLLAVGEQLRKEPTSDNTFKARLDVFRNWLLGQRGMAAKVCKYTDLMKIRYRYLAMGDKTTFETLDKWILTAEELVREAPPTKN